MSEMELRAQMLERQTQQGEVQLAQRLEQIERHTRQREDLTMRLRQIERRVLHVMHRLQEQREQDHHRMEEMENEHNERMLLMEKQQQEMELRQQEVELHILEMEWIFEDALGKGHGKCSTLGSSSNGKIPNEFRKGTFGKGMLREFGKGT